MYLLISRAVQVSFLQISWLAPIESPRQIASSMVSVTVPHMDWLAIVGRMNRDHDCPVVEKGNTKTKTPI